MDLTSGDHGAILSRGFSRRKFLAHTSSFGAFYAVAKLIPLPALAAELTSDSRVPSLVPLIASTALTITRTLTA